MSATQSTLPTGDDLFELAPSGLLVTTPDGVILRANATFRGWLGLPQQALVGQRLQGLLTRASRIFHQAHYDVALADQGSLSELKLDLLHRDGHAVPVLLNAVRRQAGGDTVDVLAMIVVTERQRFEDALQSARRDAESAVAGHAEAQRALEESLQVLGLAIRGARMGAWSHDLVSDALWWSREMEELFGLAAGAAPQTDTAFQHLIHPADRAAMAEAVERAVRDRTDYKFEFRIRHASGQWRWMEGRGRALHDARGTAITLHGLAIDTTDRKEAELVLMRQAAIFDHQTDAIVIADTAGLIVDANPACARMLGDDAARLVGRPVGQFFLRYGEDAPPLAEDDPDHALPAADRGLRRRLRFIRRDGTPGVCETVVMPLVDASGSRYGSIGVSRDITGRLHDENELRRLNAELSAADRRKDEFIATLAHELRNPLAPMRHVVELLRLKEVADPQLTWSRDVLDRQLRHLTHLVDDLLEVARITQGKLELRREPFELAVAVQAAVEAVGPFAQQAHELVVTPPPAGIVIDGDPTRITQALVNLLNNAVKYTPAGGRVELAVVRAGDEAVITVRDNGVGIAPQHLVAVFEKFAQLEPALDRAQGGLGLGLALVKGLVAMHGGQVGAESAGRGLGSLFTIRLPVVATALPVAAPKATAPASGPPVPAARVPRRVLIVDDNQDAADSLTMVLEMEGHALHTVHDGLAGVAAAAAFAPEVVLLDIGLPGLNGYEVARRIRAQPDGARMRLVAVTGWGQAQDKRLAFDAGFDHHLTKPVDLGELDGLIALGPLIAQA